MTGWPSRSRRRRAPGSSPPSRRSANAPRSHRSRALRSSRCRARFRPGSPRRRAAGHELRAFHRGVELRHSRAGISWTGGKGTISRRSSNSGFVASRTLSPSPGSCRRRPPAPSPRYSVVGLLASASSSSSLELEHLDRAFCVDQPLPARGELLPELVVLHDGSRSARAEGSLRSASSRRRSHRGPRRRAAS